MEKVKFRTGIDYISYQDTDTDKSYVASKKTLYPTIGRTPSYVRDLFDPRNSHDALEEFVKPRITMRILLIPVRFKLLRKLIFKSLKKAKYTDQSSADKVNAAMALLEDEMDNVTLFERYVHALIKI